MSVRRASPAAHSRAAGPPRRTKALRLRADAAAEIRYAYSWEAAARRLARIVAALPPHGPDVGTDVASVVSAAAPA